MVNYSLEKKCEAYKSFLELLEKEIQSRAFEEKFNKAIEIDLNHYSKQISIFELRNYILQYKKLDIVENCFEKIQVLLPGNPEIVFKICLEAMRYNLNIIMVIQDFCLAQNTIIIDLMNNIFEKLKLKTKILLKNLLSDSEIIQNSNNVYKTLCIGDSNLYNRLNNKCNNLLLNPYGIFEIYSDSNKFQELEKTMYDYVQVNQFEAELYDDLEFEDVVRLINKSGYKFCSVLFTEDKEKINTFRQKIDSKYIVINENPFKKIEFKFEI